MQSSQAPTTLKANSNHMKTPFLIALITFLTWSNASFTQNPDTIESRFFVGSTMFMLMNVIPNPPEYYQLNVGYRFTPLDVMTVEAITWKYDGPLGRQYGPDFENPESNFPGRVHCIGAGLTYKRFLWQQWYAQIHSTAFRQHYLNPEGERIQSGFQLFNTIRSGYQFRFFSNRFFLEPSIAITFWPINTNLPVEFQALEDQFSKFFLGEPGLHFGFNF